jgi:OOP family OmpA-OmpF porin
LIYNGDFEIYDTCPNQTSTLSTPELEYATGWVMPTAGTSDYFNTCNTNPNIYANVDVPNNFVGYQNAFSGNGYAGFYVYVNYINGTEYIQSKLNFALKAGYTYSVSFYVSQADSSEYSINEIGAYFSETAISRSDFAPFNFNPQVKSPNGLFLNNMNGWTKIEGTFVASGGEEYITIGNFHDSLSTDTLNSGIFSSTGQDAAYYYIDGIETIETETMIEIPNIFSPNNDGLNDVFIIENAYGNTEIHIFNRWGESINRLFGSNCYWDGYTSAGIACPDGMYFYIIKVAEKEFKGFVQLVR